MCSAVSPASLNPLIAAQFIPVGRRITLCAIFPSNIRHGVATVEHEVERLSLAFNTFFSGELGREEFSNYLSIELKK